VRGCSEEDVSAGYVLCAVDRPVHVAQQFEAQLRVVEAPTIVAAGYKARLHCHAVTEECTLEVCWTRLR